MSNKNNWHQRWHPLRREWVVYSAHRNERPWVGQTEASSENVASYDPNCFLCPGNMRSSGNRNPQYDGVYVFDNDHPVVGNHAPDVASEGFYERRPASGVSRVICYDPRHDLTLTQMPHEKVVNVFATWKAQTDELSRRAGIRFVLVFENRGEVCGTSSPHPHCQLYATNFVFKNIERELEACAETTKLFGKILEEERTGGRVVAENEFAIAFIPFFARYPYETWLFPKRRHADMRSLTTAELDGLARAYLELTKRFDGLYNSPFPFVMSLYQAPVNLQSDQEYHLHFVFLPPLRRPGILKFPAGPEIGGGNFMNDTLPEEKAAEMNAVDLSGQAVGGVSHE